MQKAGKFVLNFPNRLSSNTALNTLTTSPSNSVLKDCSVKLEKLSMTYLKTENVHSDVLGSAVSKSRWQSVSSEWSGVTKTRLKAVGRRDDKKAGIKAGRHSEGKGVKEMGRQLTVKEKKNMVARKSSTKSWKEQEAKDKVNVEVVQKINKNDKENLRETLYDSNDEICESDNGMNEESEDEIGEIEKNDQEYFPYVYKYRPKNMRKEQTVQVRRAKEPKQKKEKKRKNDPTTGRGTFPCGTCKKVYKFKRSYLAHLEDGQCSNKCKYCGKVLKRKYVRMHIFMKHEKQVQRYSCNVCGHRFFYRYQVEDHMQVHSGEKKFICDVCGMSFLRINNLAIHKKRHENEQTNTKFPCPLCKKLFASKAYVSYHLNVTHDSTRPFMCDQCGNKFKTKSAMLNHKRAYHIGERKYQCNICGNFYKYSHQVSTHKKLFHEKLTRFKCQVCNKAFYFEGVFKDHMNIHKGIKAHSCPYCDYESYTRQQLTQHKKKHRHQIGMVHKKGESSCTFPYKSLQDYGELDATKALRAFEGAENSTTGFQVSEQVPDAGRVLPDYEEVDDATTTVQDTGSH